MINILIASFIVFPLLFGILEGNISLSQMPGDCIFFGVLIFPGFALMRVLSRLFRASECFFCWIPFLIWHIEMGLLGAFVSGKFEFIIPEHLPIDIALLCAVTFYLLCHSNTEISKT